MERVFLAFVCAAQTSADLSAGKRGNPLRQSPPWVPAFAGVTHADQRLLGEDDRPAQVLFVFFARRFGRAVADGRRVKRPSRFSRSRMLRSTRLISLRSAGCLVTRS